MLLNIGKSGIQLFAAAAFFIVFNNSSFCQSSEHDVNIEYRVSGNHLNVEGIFSNNTSVEAEVSYHLTVYKQNKAGNSSTAQSGHVKIPAGSKKTLSQSKVDFSKDAVYRIHLVVQSGNITLADKELELKGSEIQKH